MKTDCTPASDVGASARLTLSDELGSLLPPPQADDNAQDTRAVAWTNRKTARFIARSHCAVRGTYHDGSVATHVSQQTSQKRLCDAIHGLRDIAPRTRGFSAYVHEQAKHTGNAARFSGLAPAESQENARLDSAPRYSGRSGEGRGFGPVSRHHQMYRCTAAGATAGCPDPPAQCADGVGAPMQADSVVGFR